MWIQPSKVVGKEIRGDVNSWIIYLRTPRLEGWNRLEEKQHFLPVCHQTQAVLRAPSIHPTLDHTALGQKSQMPLVANFIDPKC